MPAAVQGFLPPDVSVKVVPCSPTIIVLLVPSMMSASRTWLLGNRMPPALTEPYVAPRSVTRRGFGPSCSGSNTYTR